MRIAFAIMKLFPGGGLQRDCIELAREIRKRGHDLIIFTSSKDPGFAGDLAVTVLPVRRITNHGRQREFSCALGPALSRQSFDLAVGFDKLVGLDLLYCADPCIRARMKRRPYLFLLPRYRAYLALERAAFGPRSSTHVLLLSQRQSDEYRHAWLTPANRLMLLPPTVAASRRHPEFRSDGVGARLRSSLGLGPQEWLWLAIAAHPFTKGLDRSLRALREFPAAKLIVAGVTPNASRAGRAARAVAAQARRLGVTDRVLWLGHREDIPELMAAADLLVHPARLDTTGTVILEAVVNGLPVVATDICGYAGHVTAADAGIVIDEPFTFPAYCAALAQAEGAGRRAGWSAAAAKYGEQPFLYEGRRRAVEVILAAAAAAAARPCRG